MSDACQIKPAIASDVPVILSFIKELQPMKSYRMWSEK